MRHILIGILLLMMMFGLGDAARYPGGTFSGDINMMGYNFTNATTLGAFSDSYLSGGFNVAGTSALNYTTVTDIRAADDGYFAGDLKAGTLAAFNYTTVTDIRASDDGYITDAFYAGGTSALNYTTVTDIRASDDAYITDALSVGGTSALNVTTVAGAVTVANDTKVAFGTPTAGAIKYLKYVSAGNYFDIGGTPLFSDGAGWTGTLTPTSGSDFAAAGGGSDWDYHLSSGTTQTGTGAVTINGATTVATGDTLAVTDADALTVGGVKVPQEIAIPFTYTASSVDVGVFQAKGAWNITAVELVPRVVGGDAGAVNVTIKVCDSGEAPASGVAALSAVLDLKGTADTTQTGSLAATVACTAAQYIALDFTGTMTSAVGSGTIWIKRV